MNKQLKLILGSLILLSGCDLSNEGALSERLDVQVDLLINGEAVVLSEARLLELEHLSLDQPLEIEVVNTSDSVEKIKVNSEEIKLDEPYSLQLTELSKHAKVKIDVLTEGRVNTYQLKTLPSTFPEYSVEGESPYKGDYYLTTWGKHRANYIFKLDETGAVTYYQETEGIPFDFKKHVINGEVRYSYLEEDTTAQALENVGYEPTTLIVLDEEYEILDEVRLEGHEDIEANFPLDNHDVLYLDDDHYILAAYVGEEVTNVPSELKSTNEPSAVVKAVIQEVKQGEVVWQWDSSDYEQLYAMSVEEADFDNENEQKPWADYVHLNSLCVDPNDNNLIVSFRNLDAILKLDRETGDILWTLGGLEDEFGLTDDQLFSRQHFAKLTEDGSLIFYDNGVAKQQSRVVKVKLDEVNKTVLNFESFEVDDQYYSIMGSAQEIDDESDVFLIGWGGYGSTESSTKSFSEFNFTTNEELFSVTLEGDPGLYRVYKFE